MLLWSLLIVLSYSSLAYLMLDSIARNVPVPLKWSFIVSCLLSTIVSAPLLGWLADAKFGNYIVFKIGAVLLFISAVMNCSFLISEAWETNPVLKWIHRSLGGSLLVVGGCACLVTSLPLGLDQMPDASSSNITSYIAWFVCILCSGGFVFDIINYLKFSNNRNIYLVLAWVSALCGGIVLVSIFLFNPKWLIIEPKSPQSLKTIYQVLKFAAKHKAPLNRSALTYWEEDIPSRIDLSKSKYGGPFTTEQVEDVKTILGLLAMSLPLFLVVLSVSFRAYWVSPQSIEIYFFTLDVFRFLVIVLLCMLFL